MLVLKLDSLYCFLAGFILAVKDAQNVAFIAPLAFFAKLRKFIFKFFMQEFA